MTTFYICRHGESENNKNQCFSGWCDAPLTAKGERDARAVASKIQGVTFDKVISSDLGRAFITAYIVSRGIGWQKEIERSRALREVNYGDFTNQPYSVYPVMKPEANTTYTPPGGESLAQMQERVLSYLFSIAQESPGQTILMVAHDGTINAIKSSFSGQQMGIVDLSHNRHDFVGTLVVDNNKITAFSEVE